MLMETSINNIWLWCRRYITFPLVIAVGYIVFVLFFNENSYSRSAELQAEIDELQAEIKQNNDTMRYYRALYEGLNTDPAQLEKIVREHYHMQRPNEDVFIVTD